MTDEKAIAEKIMRKAERYEERARDEHRRAVSDMSAAQALAEDCDLRRAEDLMRSALAHMVAASTSLALAREIVEGARDE